MDSGHLCVRFYHSEKYLTLMHHNECLNSRTCSCKH